MIITVLMELVFAVDDKQPIVNTPPSIEMHDVQHVPHIPNRVRVRNTHHNEEHTLGTTPHSKKLLWISIVMGGGAVACDIAEVFCEKKHNHTGVLATAYLSFIFEALSCGSCVIYNVQNFKNIKCFYISVACLLTISSLVFDGWYTFQSTSISPTEGSIATECLYATSGLLGVFSTAFNIYTNFHGHKGLPFNRIQGSPH